MAQPIWRLDASRFPLVFAHILQGDGKTQPSIESVHAVLEAIDRLQGKRVIVVELTHAVPDAMRRKLLIDWTKKNWARMRSDLLGIACIAPGAFQRSIVTGLLWFIKPSAPVEVFEHREDAMRWANQQLERAGLSAPRLSMRPPRA